MTGRPWTLGAALLLLGVAPAVSRAQRALLPIDMTRSADAGWLAKSVLARRVLDDMSDSTTWRFSGTGQLTFPSATHNGMRFLRVDMRMFRDQPAPTRNGLSSVNLQRPVPGEDWREYNRLSIWIRADVAGFPMLPLQIVMRSAGTERVPDRYNREGIHFVTLAGNAWQQIVWEIEPLARDRVTMLEIGYWVNKMLAAPGDRVGFEIGRVELQRVEPDQHTGWNLAAGKVAFSHTGYQSGFSKSAVVNTPAVNEFELLRVGDGKRPDVVLRKATKNERTRLGEFARMDFSEINAPGSYAIRTGGTTTRPFRIGADAWDESIWATLNFFYGERCGYAVPGSHGVDHLDWFATHGDQRVTMAGGWHDAGDLSQGVINTGEATYAMFALAERLAARGGDTALVTRLIEEATWGLDWVLRVRFDGGYRMGFASHNLWTDNIAGTADDRSREARNNPNANYIAAAAEAIAYRVLKQRDPERASRSLRTAEDDWRYAVVGVEGPSTWHTPAFAATRLELAGIGITASLELYRATRKQRYVEKAVELARVIMASQQKQPVGRLFPLAGFFYTGPERDTLFHQFHRGNDQAPVVALGQLVEALPSHPDWMRWFSTLVLYAEYQKGSAAVTAPYDVLPAYVYRDSDDWEVPDSGALHQATRESYRAQVRSGMAMGDGWYLRTLPVWFARRGNYGILLSQAKALAASARLRGDSAGVDLAQRQAQWVMGRNPFAQSTMYGVGYDWVQQYSVSSGDFVGALPVGMQSRGDSDLPYWPSQNTYVFKEVWVHSSARWLWLMADLKVPPPDRRASSALEWRVSSTRAANGDVKIRVTATGRGAHRFEVRGENLTFDQATKRATLRPGRAMTIEWTARTQRSDAAWIAAVIADGNTDRPRDVHGLPVPR
ncbi:MAG: glycoside hydrolase family 9 protein [Gemmatimonadaceae bacterium]